MSAAPGAARDPTAAEAVRRAAATPLQVDVDDLENRPALSDNADSPTKRTRWDVQRPPPAGSSPSPVSGISLADLTAALAPLTAGVTEMRQRLTEVETPIYHQSRQDVGHGAGTQPKAEGSGRQNTATAG